MTPLLLSETDHPYYGPETHLREYKSWTAFNDEWCVSDVDLNLIWRWDWQRDPDDPDQSTFTLRICMVHPRHSRFSTHDVIVTIDDEPAVRMFLDRHWQTIKAIWAPFTADGAPTDEIVKQLRARRIASLKAELAMLEAE